MESTLTMVDLRVAPFSSPGRRTSSMGKQKRGERVTPARMEIPFPLHALNHPRSDLSCRFIETTLFLNLKYFVFKN